MTRQSEGPARATDSGPSPTATDETDNSRHGETPRALSKFLLDGHRRELADESSISAEIIEARGYETINRPAAGTSEEHRRRLKALGFPTFSYDEDRYFPGLLIPMYGPTGQRVSYQWKPRVPVSTRDGRTLKYASPKARESVIDVHPSNFAKIVDPTEPLWITEGVKKGDALASRGLCAIALSGVFNWRSKLATLGDWEDVALKGRTVVVCFDSDAWEKSTVLNAMTRLGRWLKSKQAKVTYLIVPAEHDGTPTKGVDDFFAAGGTLDDLRAVASPREPRPVNANATFTDARLAETISDEALADRYMWVGGRGWLGWDGRRWRDTTDVAVGEAIRQYALERFTSAVEAYKNERGESEKLAVEGWTGLLSVGRERAVLSLAKGIVERRIDELDADPDVLNVANGIVDLTTGNLLPHDPDALITKVAGTDYVPGADHADWKQALEAVPDDSREWLQAKFGQGITGYMSPDDVLPILQGGGSNGKTTTLLAISNAAGDYHVTLSDRVLLANPDAHPTEFMDLQGARLATMEETPEARRLDPQRLKRTIGTPKIKARHIRQDSVEFTATHTMFIATNHRPVVNDSDHGTWRRLALVRFPYTFRKPGTELHGPNDRHGDPALRGRVAVDPAIWTAALAWLVDGARKWYAAGQVLPEPPEQIETDTREWRRDSDLVLSFLDENLIFDPSRHVISSELLSVFSGWLESNGHTTHTTKTLAAKLDGHDELTRHRVERRKGQRPNDSLSRWPRAIETPPAQYLAWHGLRFRTADDDRDQGEQAPDQGEPADVTDVTALPTNALRIENFPSSEVPSHPSHDPVPAAEVPGDPAAGEWSCPVCGGTVGRRLTPSGPLLCARDYTHTRHTA